MKTTSPAPTPRRPAAWSRPVAVLDRLVTWVDDAADRLWSSRLNPLHQSGTIAITCFGVLVVTGLYLFLFYSIDDPYESVVRIEDEILLGSWVRTLHTYAADLALVAIVVHALKMFLAGRFSGARVRAWLTGVVLTGIVLLCGWTGQVMVWDLQAQLVAVELTRLLDLLPLFSMPLSRAFDGLAAVPSSFFFMNLFLHVCLPLGLAFVLWLHVSRIARPALSPPKPVLWTLLGVLGVLAAGVRVPIAAPADLLAIPRDVPTDLVFNFWLPAAWHLGPAGHAALWALVTVVFSSVPWWWRRTRPVLAPSWVDPDKCTGCTTCYKDCPFDAITMVERPDPGRRSEVVALVNPDRCVACGVCAGSCAPMGVGPPAWTGRMQMKRAGAALAAGYVAPGDVVVFACAQNPVATDARLAAMPGVKVRTVECAGGLHTSVLDVTLRAGAAGTFVLTCPPRSAACREGPKWLFERLYNDREAELPPRVDKRRVAIGGFSRGEWPQLEAAVRALQETVAGLAAPAQSESRGAMARVGGADAGANAAVSTSGPPGAARPSLATSASDAAHSSDAAVESEAGLAHATTRPDPSDLFAGLDLECEPEKERRRA